MGNESTPFAGLSNLRIDRGTVPLAGRSRWAGRSLWALLAGAALLSATVWVSSRPIEPELAGGPVHYAAPPVVSTSLATGGLTASGYVVARRVSTVASLVTARVVEVYVEEGASVRTGDILARLDATIASAVLRVAKDEAEVADAQRAETEERLNELEARTARYEALANHGHVSVVLLDQLRSETAALRARLFAAEARAKAEHSRVRLADLELSHHVIRAPFAGVVVSKDAQPGEIVSPVSGGGSFTRTGIATVVDMNSREIEVEVNEAFIQRVAVAQRVEAVLDAYPDKVFAAHVAQIVPTANRTTATVRVRVAFAVLSPEILPDMAVKVRFLEET